MIHFRRGTSDERVLEEVIERRCYRRATANFDVERGERWLDLGANIGAFALYCKQRGAVAECYEPDPDCFELLRKNVPEFKCFPYAVIAGAEKNLNWYRARKKGVHSRNSLLNAGSLCPAGMVKTYCARRFTPRWFDGVKMDIEGSEGPIIDHWALPRCNKLVLEYHTSRDSNISNLARRLKILKQHFEIVSWPPEYDRAISSGAETFKSFFDRNIWCYNES